MRRVALTLSPAFATVAALLVLAGVAKVRRPGPASDAAATLLARPLPRLNGAIRVLGAVEIALGLVCLLAPGRAVAALLAGVYLLFAAVVLGLRRVSASCGCFGEDLAPAGLLHAGLDIAAAAVAAAAAIAGPAALPELLDRPAGEAAVALLAVAGAVYAAWAAFTLLPRVWNAWGTT
jgi:hypothetical protein